MIFTSLLDILLDAIIAFIMLIPVVNIELPAGLLNGLSYLLYGIGWFLPLNGLIPIIAFSVAITGVRITIALFRLVVDVIGAAH